MTNRYDEIGKFTRAMTEVRKIRNELDTSVLEEIDLKVLEGFDAYCDVYTEYAVMLLTEMWGDALAQIMGKVKE